jgi:hypothetical protein
MPCGRRDFATRPVLRASLLSDSEAGIGGCFPRGAGRLSSVVKDSGKKLSGLEPFVDVEEAKRLAEEAERMRYLRQMAREKKEDDLQQMLEDTVLDFDVKQGGEYYTRFTFADLTKFDLDEECKSVPIDSISDQDLVISIALPSMDNYKILFWFGWSPYTIKVLYSILC